MGSHHSEDGAQMTDHSQSDVLGLCKSAAPAIDNGAIATIEQRDKEEASVEVPQVAIKLVEVQLMIQGKTDTLGGSSLNETAKKVY